MERRPTWAKNFRRFGFKSLRSHSWAPSWRRNASLATSLLREPGLSPAAPCPSHLRVDQLFEALASSRPSNWARLSALSKGSTRVYVLSCARPRAERTSRTIRSGAGKTSLSVRNRSRARRKRTFGASCSRARSSLPSFEFFQVP